MQIVHRSFSSDHGSSQGSNRGPTDFVRFASAVVALVLALGVAAPNAEAQQEIVTFDLTAESVVSLLGGTLEVPRDGEFTVGSLKLSFPVTAPGAPIPGGLAVLSDFTLAGNLSKDVQGEALVSGTFAADQTADLEGVLSAGLDQIDFLGASLSLFMDVDLGCVGSGCSILGLPASEFGPAFFAAGVLSAFNLGQVGQARLEATMPIELAGVLGTFDLVAIESSRVFVPEPGTALLLASGLVLLARRSRMARRA